MSGEKRSRMDISDSYDKTTDKVDRRSMLIPIQKSKKTITTEIRTWENIFTNAPLMANIIRKLHLFDIINMASTCQQIYRFYYGDTILANLLREIVLQDIGGKYKKRHPLRYLGDSRNTKNVIYDHQLIYISRLCSSCSIEMSNFRDHSDMFIKDPCCRICREYYSYFCTRVYPKIESKCKELYITSCLPRIARYVGRFAVNYGKILKPLYDESYRLEVDKITELMLSSIAKLDVVKKVKIRLTPIK